MGKIIIRFFITLIGGFFFYLSIALKYSPKTLLIGDKYFELALFTVKTKIPLILLWLTPLLTFFLVIIFSQTGRKIFKMINQKWSHLTVVFLVVLIFLLTLIPQKFDGKIMISYLALATNGYMLLLYGLYPLLKFGKRFLYQITSILLYRLNSWNFLILLTLIFFIITNLISWLVFQHIPHIMDSIAQVFQARIFTSGQLYLPAIYDDYFFSFFGVFNDGTRWYGIAPFGHPLLLMFGSFLKMEWLINPLLGSITLIVFYFLGKEIYDERTGRITALLGFISPFIIFMSSEFMNHTSALLFISLFILFFFRAIKSEKLYNPIFAGACLGMVVNIRPLTAFAIALPLIVYSFYLLIKSRGKLFFRLFLIGLLTLFGLGAFLIYNYLTTGNLFMSGYKAYSILEFHHTRWGLGFGQKGWDWWGAHTPLRGLVQTGNNLNALNKYLFESPIPGLFLILLLFITPRRNAGQVASESRPKGLPYSLGKKKEDYLLALSFLMLPIAYFFYWFQDLCFGPRFLFEALAPILLLSSRGIIVSSEYIKEVIGLEISDRVKDGIRIGFAFSLLTTLFVNLPPLLKHYKASYWGVDNKIYQRVKRAGIKNGLIFVQSDFPYFGSVWDSYYGSAFLRNTLKFKSNIIYARDRGKDNYILMRNFPERTYYYADKDTLYVIDTLPYKNAQQIIALEEAGKFFRDFNLSEYKSIFLPIREMNIWLSANRQLSVAIKTYRTLSHELFLKPEEFDNYLPALGIWLMTDQREYIAIFQYMRGLQNFIIEKYRFTLLFTSENRLLAVYDIRPATGEEIILPQGPE